MTATQGCRRSALKCPVAEAPAFRARLSRWFQKDGRDLPWRRTRDPYAVLVSEVMLQQTTVATVRGHFERWMKRFPSAVTLAQADEEEVLRAWQGLGYYSRARNLHRAARQIGAHFPEELDAIHALPGVGRYTAHAVATFAFDRAVPVVEANVARVLARLLDMQLPIDGAAGAARLWETAEALLPRRGARDFNSALMDLGALICTPRTPRCTRCPVRSFCATNDPDSLPRKKPRPAPVELREVCAWTVRQSSVLLEMQRDRHCRGMWRLPLLPAANGAAPLYRTTYPFTHHRVRLEVFAMCNGTANEHQRWFPIDQLPALPSPHRRAIAHLSQRSLSS